MESIDQAWQNWFFPMWESPDSAAATTMEMATVEPEEFEERTALQRTQSADVAVLVAGEPGGGETNLVNLGERKKYFWFPAISPGSAYTSVMMPIIYQVLEDDLGFPGEAVGSVSPWPVLWRQSEPQPADLRGVFRTNYPRKLLFTKPVTFKTSELPRWKPKTIIGLRTFEERNA